jgi:hypothetical protein
MRTEELLRYEAEYKAMREALGTDLLVFVFPKQMNSWVDKNRTFFRQKKPMDGSDSKGLYEKIKRRGDWPVAPMDKA